MKTKNKALTLAICAVLLIGLSVMGTLAYLTSTATVINTFTVGEVKIELTETAVDKEGNPIEGADRVTTNNYHLIPGQSYTKDPTVTVKAGSESSYVRMIMTVHNQSAVQAIIDNHELGDYKALFSGWNQSVWLYECFVVDDANNTISFEFRYKDAVSGFDAESNKTDIVLEPLFTKVLVPDNVTGEELKALYGLDTTADDDFKLTVEGHAIQAATFADANEAWANFTK